MVVVSLANLAMVLDGGTVMFKEGVEEGAGDIPLWCFCAQDQSYASLL